MQKHTVKKLANPTRLPDYAIGVFSTTKTKSALKKAIKKRRLKVNEKLATTATLLYGGEIITLIDPPINPKIKQLNFHLKVLFEDEHLAAIYKPGGILVSGNSFKTISNALNQTLKRSSLNDSVYPQPVHRLDYPTTGVLLIGKTQSCIQLLNQLFEKKEVQKVYYAVSIGKMPRSGSILESIDNKNSRSDYIVEEHLTSTRFEALNLVKILPKTGRRHQIRKHFSSINHPILGDQEYGIEPFILKGKGLYLHAHQITFIHPFTNKHITITASFPKRFIKLFGDKLTS